MNEIHPRGGIWSAWKHADIVDSTQCLHSRPIRGRDGARTSGYREGEITFGLTVSGTEGRRCKELKHREEYEGRSAVESITNPQPPHKKDIF